MKRGCSEVRPPKCLSGCRAFTLIELLVVVAVIAILMGVLLPSLGRARATALDIKCMNNLRQIGIAIGAYQNDHQPATYLNILIPARPDRPQGPFIAAQWNAMVILEDYTDGQKELFRCPSASGVTSVLHWREERQRSAEFVAKDLNDDGEFTYADDLVNEYWFNSTRIEPDQATGGGSFYGVSGNLVRRVRKPAEVAMVTDHIDWVPFRHTSGEPITVLGSDDLANTFKGRVHVLKGDLSITKANVFELFSPDRFGSYPEFWSWGNHYPPRQSGGG